ncbi:WG repeat-containing protein [Chamaesiphon sp. OTE_75_metabat_556]|uniref:WG repeat-containing protein n=1 Tax=Chamaesiphon sp. OTE_75_metabat_556 TaxID=2964692 RepID=UPI00286BD91C|nr:WG repeat-containing protein [Chamaesiphon sp. OTE_75_metabat_556]
MSIKKLSLRTVIPALLILIAILPLSSCGNNLSSQSSSSSDPVKTATSKNLDRFLFRKNGKLGFVDRTGKIVIPAKFDRIDEGFSKGLASVSINNKWGYIDPMGKIVIPLKFEQAINFHEGLGAVQIGGKWGFVDPIGKIVIPAQLETYGRFDHGLAYIYTGNQERSFTIDKTGKVVATPSPDPAKEATTGGSDQLIPFDENNKVGYKDRAGKIVVPAQFDTLGFDQGGFNDGFAPVCLNRKCGYIDKTGKIVVPLQFDLVANRFNDGLAWVNIGKKLGYINKTGKLVIPARYGKADIGKGVCNDSRPCLNGTKFSDAYPDFDRGLAIVAIPECKQAGKKNCNRSGYIDTTGKLVFEF